MIKLNVFPQIIRIFSASLLWGSFAGVVFINVMNVPQSSTNVLGAQAEKESIEREYAFWREVIKEKSDYRDAYLTLASLAYQLSKLDEAKNYTHEALRLDPNSSSAWELLQVFGG